MAIFFLPKPSLTPRKVTSLMFSPPYPNADCDKTAGCTPFEMNIVGTTTLTHTKITYQKGRHQQGKSHFKVTFDLQKFFLFIFSFYYNFTKMKKKPSQQPTRPFNLQPIF